MFVQPGSATVTASGMTPTARTVRIFLPFAAGFFLLYVFRVVNAPIASQLRRDLGISASALGMLTAIYLLAPLVAPDSRSAAGRPSGRPTGCLAQVDAAGRRRRW
jgi:zinc transporter ZupT